MYLILLYSLHKTLSNTELFTCKYLPITKRISNPFFLVARLGYFALYTRTCHCFWLVSVGLSGYLACLLSLVSFSCCSLEPGVKMSRYQAEVNW